MKRKIAVVFIGLFACSVLAWAQQPQDNKKPLTKEEVVVLLKQMGKRSLTQSDIVDEVERRGIAFPVDEKVLSELRQDGAKSFLLDAIKRAGENGGKAQMNPDDFGAPADPADEEAVKKAEAEAIAKLPLIEQTRRHALEYANELPNFIVNQKVSRYIQTPDSRNWKLEDTLEIELTYSSEKGEQFKLLRVNGRASQQSYDDLGGSTSSGEFGSLIASLFARQSRAEFKEAKKDTLNGRATVIYDFSVKTANSNSTIADKGSGRKVVAGYSGSIWIDTESKQVLRIEASNEGMPANFPITLSENAVEYDWVKIEEERYLLPIRAELILGRDKDRVYTRNVIEFHNYQKFGARIKID
jgi:hypothetical protein